MEKIAFIYDITLTGKKLSEKLEARGITCILIGPGQTTTEVLGELKDKVNDLTVKEIETIHKQLESGVFKKEEPVYVIENLPELPVPKLIIDNHGPIGAILKKRKF